MQLALKSAQQVSLRCGHITKRGYSLSAACAALPDDFEAAKARLGTLQEDPGNEKKLEIYGLFKQATVGPVGSDTPTPGMFDMVGKAKFGAWQTLGPDLSKEEAMKAYITLIDTLVGAEPAVEETSAVTGTGVPARPTLRSVAYPRSSASQSVTETTLKTIKTSLTSKGVLTVTLNRPHRGNSFNVDMWADLATVFSVINTDSAVRAVILTGNEKAFSTGMDLSVFQVRVCVYMFTFILCSLISQSLCLKLTPFSLNHSPVPLVIRI